MEEKDDISNGMVQHWLDDVEKVARIGRWEVDLINMTSYLTHGVFEIFEITDKKNPSLDELYEFYDEDYRGIVDDVYSNLIEHGLEGEYEAKITTEKGNSKWVHVIVKILEKQSDTVTKIYGTVQDITEYKKSELQLNLMINSTEEGFVFVDKEFNVLTFNKRFKKEYEKYFDKKVVKGMSIFDLSTPERRPVLKQVYESVFSGNIEKTIFETNDSDNEEKKLFNILFKPAYDDHNSIIGAFVSVVNITAQTEANAKVLESESRFRSLVENGSDGVAIVNPDGSLQYVTASVKGILGYSIDEVMKINLFDLVHEEDKAPSALKLQIAFQTPGVPVQGHTSRMLHKDGTWRWIEAVVTNMLDDPAINGIVDNFRDVTVQYEAELELERVNKQLRTHLENSPLGVIEYDKNLIITKWSKKCEEIFGWTEEEILSKKTSAFSFIYNEDKEVVRNIANELTAAEVSGNISTNRNFTKSGEIIDCRWYNSVITDDNGSVSTIMSLVQDISHQVKIEHEQQKSIKEKSTLLAEIHHRVKNNLAIVSGLMQLQVFKSDNEEANMTLLDSVSRIKSIALVHEQLYNSKDFQNISFDKNLSKLVESISAIMNQNDDVQIEYDLRPVKLTINQAVPCALFVNEAVTNAFKHAFEEKTKGVLKISCSMDNELVKVAIGDNGTGFDKTKYVAGNESLGIKLLEMVSDQLKGDLQINTKESGTSIGLTFLRSSDSKGSYGAASANF